MKISFCQKVIYEHVPVISKKISKKYSLNTTWINRENK